MFYLFICVRFYKGNQMKVKYRVIYNPRIDWFEIEKKLLFIWVFVQGKVIKEDAIKLAKEYCQGLIVWESDK